MTYEQKTSSMRDFVAAWVASYQDFDRKCVAFAERLEMGYVIVDAAPNSPVYNDGDEAGQCSAIGESGDFLAGGIGEHEDFEAAWASISSAAESR